MMMYKEKIVVPEGIRYISDWNGYDLGNYGFPHILNKVLTGCGYTEYCLRNWQNIILVSPRRFLLDNKEEQHPGEVYYFRNELESISNYELDISKIKPIKSYNPFLKINEEEERKKTEERAKILQGMKDKLWSYITIDCLKSRKPAKILVTYDSFRHVKDLLVEKGVFQNYQVVIDEFQSIFIDSRFKSDTELELLYQLRGVDKLCFVSATPMLDEYLGRLDEFKNLPYYELDWESSQPGRVKKPRLEVKFTYRTLGEELNKVIQLYQCGKFESRKFQTDGGEFYEIESREAVLFMNSVKGICQAIRTNRLHLGECNVLCAKTSENSKAIRKAFNEVIKKDFQDREESGLLGKGEKIKLIKSNVEVIGKIPVKGESHKMFTFCTRTVYLGADFYSTNARTFIFSDSNIDCLSVDISMDLEQILGRQRLDENPWKDSAIMFVRTTVEDMKRTREDFNKYLDKKIAETETLLGIYIKADKTDEKLTLADRYKKLAATFHYKDDYVAVNRHAGFDLLPVFNNLVLVSEQRAFDVQQIDYADRFTVFNSLNTKFEGSEQVKEFVKLFDSLGNTENKFKALVEFSKLETVSETDLNNIFQQIPEKYGDYFRILGPNKISACKYKDSELKQEFNKLKNNSEIYPELSEEIYKNFMVGNRYTKSEVKKILGELYKKIGYKKTAKSTDLVEFFIVKNILTPDKKAGYEIIAKK